MMVGLKNRQMRGTILNLLKQAEEAFFGESGLLRPDFPLGFSIAFSRYASRGDEYVHNRD